MAKLIIDRFEGSLAVCEKEDKSICNIDRNLLPDNAKEGDVLIETDGVYTIDKTDTDIRRKKVEELQNKLFQ